MAITVRTQSIKTSSPLTFVLADRSGAHTTLTASIAGRPPISHSFDVDEGDLRVELKLNPGHYQCAFTVQVFRHGALSGMYNSSLVINSKLAAEANGFVDDSQDIGFEMFDLEII